MNRPFQRLRQFLAELKRRKVYRVAVTYVIVAAGAVQLVGVAVPASRLPGWSDEFFLGLAIFGFPIAVILAWAFEVTPDGVRRTPDAESAGDEVAESDGGVAAGYKALVGLGLVAATVAGGWYLTGGGSGSTVSDRTVAVLPFETLGDRSSSSLTAGVHNALINRLQQVGDLTVIARKSVLRYEDVEETDKTLLQVADELGARWIVTGTVQTVDDQILVNPHLIDPRTGTDRWTEAYRRDRSAGNVFELQGEITKRIARSLEAELSPGEVERVEREPTQDLEAYRLYAEGRRLLDQRTVESVTEAATAFQRALERDSTFAKAWAGLAEAMATPFFVGEEGKPAIDRSELPGPRRAAQRALRLDPDLPEGHTALGYVHFQRHNAPAALEELRRAVALKPSSENAHYLLGFTYVIMDRLPDAIEHLELAVDLNPLHRVARHTLGDAYLLSGQAEKSLEVARSYERRLAGTPEAASAIWMEARALYELERFREARSVLREGLSSRDDADGPPDPIWYHHLTAVEAAVGDTGRARRYLARLREAQPPPYLLAVAYSAVGERDSAFAAYDRVKEWPWVGVLEMRYTWTEALRTIREDPRYEGLLRRANVAWGLDPDGSLPDSVNVSLGAPSS